MKELKLVQLSDLHCDGTDEWTRGFADLAQSAAECCPDVVVVTGDCVDQPTRRNYDSLSNSMKDFIRCVEDARSSSEGNVFLITVPGNHDYYYFGNSVIPGFSNRARFEAALPNLLHPGNEYDDICRSLVRELHLAIYPMDSNDRYCGLGLAQGRIQDARAKLREMDKRRNHFAVEAGVNPRDLWRLILVHHHPLPVANSRAGEQKEPFLLFKNAHEFLHAAVNIGAHLILHGHKHVSSDSRYGMVDPQAMPISVCSCGSSARRREPTKEYRLYEFSASGECVVKRYVAENSSYDFRSDERTARELIDYATVRMRTGATIPPRAYDGCTAQGIERKTKVVRIQDDGDALIDLSIDGIAWQKGATSDTTKWTEHIRADTGRISGGEATFGSSKTLLGPGRPWAHPNLSTESYPGSTEPDEFDLQLAPQGQVLEDRNRYCRIAYRLNNGFTLTDTSHEESYPKWPEGHERIETSTIETTVPANLLELRVRFPSKRWFPNPDRIWVYAYFRRPFEQPSLEVLYGELELDTWETRFLGKSAAVAVYPSLREVAVRIEHPRPDLLYTLRWDVAKRDQAPLVKGRSARVAATLRAEFCDEESPRVAKFYADLVRDVKKGALEDQGVELFLLGFDDVEKVLRVVKHPSAHPPVTDILLGRGVAGKSFKTRRPQWWERQVDPGSADGSSHLEHGTVKDLKPIVVFCLPLIYPHSLIDLSETDEELSVTEGAPAIGVLSITGTAEGSAAQALVDAAGHPSNDSDGEDIVARIYGLIRDSAQRNFTDLLQQS